MIEGAVVSVESLDLCQLGPSAMVESKAQASELALGYAEAFVVMSRGHTLHQQSEPTWRTW